MNCNAARPVRVGVYAAIAVLYGLSLASCETSFEPFAESDTYFSMFGYLNTASDTQFIRVSPLRNAVYTSSDPLDAAVRLRLPSGEEVALREDIHRLTNGAFAHVYSVPVRIVQGERYTVEVTRSDGARSAAVVVMPDSFPDPILETGILLDSIPPYQQRIELAGINNLIDFEISYLVRRDTLAPVETVTISYLENLAPTSGGFALGFDAYRDVRRSLSTNACLAVLGVQIDFTVGDDQWPELLGVDDETIALPHTLDNVENGLGFVGGIVPKTYAWPALLSVLEENRKLCLD